jgi:non-specific serine/threonine protein kinase
MKDEKTSLPLYRYRFGSAEFDESRFELRVGGLAVELEQKPLQLLAELLRRVDEVVTRESLLKSIWRGRPTVDAVLGNAVNKLRKALGESDAALIVTVPRVGYRLTGPVERTAVGRRLLSSLELKPGVSVPGRETFVLQSQLSGSHGSELWLARDRKTDEQRVFKFSSNGERLGALRREVTLYRVLKDGLGDRPDLGQLVRWNFETPPFYVECQYGGVNLAEWAQAEGSLNSMSRDERLAIVLQIVDAVSAAHSVGVLHKDLKPENVLVRAGVDGAWQVSVIDFGSGKLLEPDRLEELRITRMGFTPAEGIAVDSNAGTPLYLAPELIDGKAPTVQSDVYALGMLLYQVLVPDLRKPLAPGWEDDIGDPVLCEDIAAATQGKWSLRLAGAAELADRLRRLPERRLALEQTRATRERMELAERALDRARARLPWLLTAILTLAVGALVSLWLYRGEKAARLRSEHEVARADAINRFLNDDLLAAADPSGPGGSHNPPMREVLERAAARLESRFTDDPATKASIQLAISNAYFGLSDYPKTEEFRQQAVSLLTKVHGVGDAELLEAEYQLASVLLIEGKFAAGAALLDRADQLAGERRNDNSQLAYQAHWTRASYFKLKNDAAAALAEYQAADRIRKAIDPNNLALLFRVRDGIAWCELRLGRNQEAEGILRALFKSDNTPDRVGPIVWVMVRMDYATALTELERYDEAEQFFTTALAEIRRSLGNDHFFAGAALNELGELYVRQGRWDRAGESYRQAYDVLRLRTGDDSQGTLIAQANLGIVEFHAGDSAKAVEVLRPVRDNLVRQFGESSPQAQSVSFYLACAQSALGHGHEASDLSAHLDAVALAAAEPRNDWPLRLQALKGEILLMEGRADAAVAQLEPAVAAMQAAHTPTWDLDPIKDALQRAQQALSGQVWGRSELR